MIKDEIAYILVESSFRISNSISDECFDDELNLKPNTYLWVKFKAWLGWHLYHNGCWFYS